MTCLDRVDPVHCITCALVLFVPFIGLLCFTLTLSDTHTQSLLTTTKVYLWTLSCQSLIESPSSLLSLTEAVLGDCARVSVSAHFECQPAPWRVPEGHRAQPLPVRHPAGHSAGHPVRL